MKYAQFTGIGVGPGDPELITVAGVNAMQQADVIFLPRSRKTSYSVAGRIIEACQVAPEQLREIEFNMDPDPENLAQQYTVSGKQIAKCLNAGQQVAYLTLGDAFTYSTYIYILRAVLQECPDINHKTIPGITSYCATAAALAWPLGEKKNVSSFYPAPKKRLFCVRK